MGGLLVAAVAAVVVVSVAAAQAEESAVLKPVRECADLKERIFPIPKAKTRVTAAVPVAQTPTEPGYCDVEGYVEPAVEFHLKLPLTTYTGRYLQVGCGGLCGYMPELKFPEGCLPKGGDFAMAATNDGHDAEDEDWAANNQAARDDYFFRAPHVVSLASKKIIQAFYGSAPKQSYFSSCSNGGREALMLAQRYPDDFDGIAAGAPAAYYGPLVAYQAWLARANTAADGSSVLSATKLPALHNAVLKACDGLDGLVDGQLEDPRHCSFDPAAVQCSGDDRADCLTQAQVETVRKLYAGPTDEHGRRLYPGNATHGSELAWNGWIIPLSGSGSVAAMLAENALRYMMYPIGAPHSSLADFKFTQAEFHRLTAEGYQANAMNLDLSAFRRAGGKLVLWHGWSDEALPAHATVDYYQRLGGFAKNKDWARLFMVPSLFHCASGDELTEFDPLKEMVEWVERGKAPERVIATGRNEAGEVTRTRPVFPYPLQAKYDGSGSVNDASNFVPAPPTSPTNDKIDWVGTYLHAIPGPRA
ncbi:tannase/feruloyl esterase family alpha/beta hydrolase [Kibdelosporangium philippinense]|uniref:Tannase/feruloyl esterase family alpha/beta hydrolase n=2 Tax=Kibdelosporangium philippinense TaxID=211113 RepID=A0ABS8Z6N4_9PSEU|nr:tannase/feruloyl esterase family alpha/beta hydrolase [Kibdelosporangium philippinense]MCE7003539.1 tannase/feruloyl esterase family alpha/beta hydrolase [Kibdelosporangium philippinense]